MKTLFKHSLLPVLAFSILAACDPKIDAPTPTLDGQIDLTNYVAIGNSITAGFASNGLYLEGQKVAYPVLLAQQFKLAGGGDFVAPLFSQDQAAGTGYLRLLGFSGSTPLLVPVSGSPNAVLRVGDSLATNASLNPTGLVLKPFEGAKINNWGVPGIRIADIEAPGYAFPNSYYGRLVPEAEKLKPYATKILEQNPTFFSCWLGNNDVLGYSTAGGYVDIGNITSPSVFTQKYTNLINNLTALGTKPKGVLANIPDVTSLPFFTTVTPAVKSGMTLAGIQNLYEFKFDSIFQNTLLPILTNPDPAVVILNQAKVIQLPVTRLGSLGITGKIEGDIFLPLTFSVYAPLLGKPGGKVWNDVINSLLDRFVLPPPFNSFPKEVLRAAVWVKAGIDTTQPFGVHPKNPIPDVFVLDQNETARAKNTVSTYNQFIKNLADSKGLAYVDANSFLSGITKGAYFDAVSANSSFISGGVFSLDGVHLTPRGNAMAANEFIKAINEKYGTKITVLNVGQYKGVTFP